MKVSNITVSYKTQQLSECSVMRHVQVLTATEKRDGEKKRKKKVSDGRDWQAIDIDSQR